MAHDILTAEIELKGQHQMGLVDPGLGAKKVLDREVLVLVP